MATNHSYIVNNLGFQLLHHVESNHATSISPLAALGPVTFLLHSAADSHVTSAVDQLLQLNAEDKKLAPEKQVDMLVSLADSVINGEPEFITIHVTNGICLPSNVEVKDVVGLKKAHLLVEKGADGVKQANTLIEQASNNQLKGLIKCEGNKVSLFSSMYLKAPFCNLFLPDSTAPGTFHVDPHKNLNVPFMSYGSMLEFNEDKDAGLRMMSNSFNGCNYDIVVMVPTKKFGLAEMEKKLTGEKFTNLLKTGRTVMGSIKLPRLNLDNHIDLKDAFQKAGLKEAFESGKSSLSKSIPGHLDSMQHGVSVRLNEFGSNIEPRQLQEHEMMMPCLGGFTEMPEQQGVVADEPFLLAVVSTKHKALVSLHRVLAPH